MFKLMTPALATTLLCIGTARAAEPPPAAKFTVPEGFVVEQVAGPPMVGHPMMASFDDRGRLFVAESAGQNLKADELLSVRPNLIRLLEDTDGDGRFDKSTVFADKMTFPMGVLWHAGALYTASPPSIWRLEDNDGDGVADERTELITKFGFTGNAADIHGPFLAPDGRLYWTDGRHGHEIIGPDGNVMKGKAARIFRSTADGKQIEVVCGGGMDDPVEICFTPEGEALATVDILIGRPSRIDAVIHCIYGGVFPHYEQVLGEFKRTGDLLPAVADLGWVAPAGLTRYRDAALGPEYRDNLFTAQFNTHKIQRHLLMRQGATFQATNEDFLVSADPDFHPTDVLEDADGSLLVIDTGGWFRIGCPTSQIAKPEIKGGIYRVRRVDASGEIDPRGLKLTWDQMGPNELVALLDDRRFAVRDRAIRQLAELGDRAVPALREAIGKDGTTRLRRNALWAATRIDTAEARAVVRGALSDRDASIRTAAAHSAALYRDTAAQKQLLDLVVSDESAAVRRDAATALGRLQSAGSVPALFEALAAGTDRFLEHSLIYALIEIADRNATLQGLANQNSLVQRAALIALDQMDDGDLPRQAVVGLLNNDDPALRQTAWLIVTARPEWARDVIGLMREWLERDVLTPSQQSMLRSGLIAFCRNAAVTELVAGALGEQKTPPAARLALLETIDEMPLDKIPPAWSAPLNQALNDRDVRIIRQAITVMRAHRDRAFDEALLRVANDETRPDDVRVAALTALSSNSTSPAPPLFDLLRGRLHPDLPALDRVAAAEALANVRLDDGQLLTLSANVAQSGPLEIFYLLAVYEGRDNPQVGAKLIAALARSPGLENLSGASLRRTLEKYPSAVRQSAQSLFERLDVDAATREARLAELAGSLELGDVKRGRGLFFSSKAACSACHTIGADGGRVGPDLSKIGAIRSRRDLLEAIVFPSASIVRSYEPYLIATAEGKAYTGLIARETADAVHLIAADRTETRIARASIESIERGRLSIMPQGLDGQLTPRDLADLLSLLESLK